MFEDRLPTKSFDVVKLGTKNIVIEVEPREVRFSDNPVLTPKAPNAWRYIREGSRDDRGGVLDAALGPIINVWRGEKLNVTWVNHIGSMANPEGFKPVLQMPPINAVSMELPNDPWKYMNPSVGVVTHLHGAKVEAGSDGWPLQPASFPGNPYLLPTHLHTSYSNDQRAAMLWFHDHAMDNTSPQVHAGLAGLYFVRDEFDQRILDLIGGPGQEIPLVLQDRKFDCCFQSVNFWAGVPTQPIDGQADQKEFVRPEYLGDTAFVNGRPSPYVELMKGVYRLRILNGSNARTYALALIDPAGWASMDQTMSQQKPKIWYNDCLTVIGNDGGLLSQPLKLEVSAGLGQYILIAPGERLDLLLDLTGVDPMAVPQLRLVNLAVASAVAGDWPEAIFQTEEPIDFPDNAGGPVAAAPSSLVTLPADAFDLRPLGALGQLGCANLLQICLDPMAMKASSFDAAALAGILAEAASGDDFLWNGAVLDRANNANPARNRFIILMNNTADPPANDFTGETWRDTQIWEMLEVKGERSTNTPFNIPFDVDLSSANPAQGQALAAGSPPKGYFVTRASFFEHFPAQRRIDKDGRYDDLNSNAQLIRPKAGTYERWYVANLTNEQNPLKAGSGGDKDNPPTIPDMHPFHMHLVNFVVTRRWRLNATTNVFDETTGARALDFDRTSRHDTVRVQSNELLELLVYFPPGYKGRYPYHCHIVEHEDMGMMSHFEVEA
jgi:FtsP/CotA-like multicopper oxidase with cupredoxin domain